MPDSIVLRPSKNKVALNASKNSIKQFDPSGTLPDVVWAFVSPNLIVSIANVAGV